MSHRRTRIARKPIIADRTRCIGKDGFSFFPNRFRRDGFFASLGTDELLLYFFLVLAGDRNGLSFYHYDSICTLLRIPLERYVHARDELISRDLIAFDGTRFQALSLPVEVRARERPALRTEEEMEANDAATIRLALQRTFQID
jgi:hypothetical protein